VGQLFQLIQAHPPILQDQRPPGQSGLGVDFGRRRGLDSPVNYILVMRNEREDLVAIGPVSIEYQAAMIRDELEESAGWTAVGIARVLTEEQARTIAGATPA
jgi:hypothetical protein